MLFADVDQTLRDAIVEVAEASFFAFTGPLDAQGFASLAAAPGGDPAHPVAPWFSTRVAFTGDRHGAIEVVVPEALAVSLVGGFLGIDPTEPIEPDALLDGMGELANMICGTWLTRTCRDGRFDLSPPAVATRQGAPSIAPIGQAAPEAAVHMAVNDLPLRVAVHRS